MVQFGVPILQLCAKSLYLKFLIILINVCLYIYVFCQAVQAYISALNKIKDKVAWIEVANGHSGAMLTYFRAKSLYFTVEALPLVEVRTSDLITLVIVHQQFSLKICCFEKLAYVGKML